jgi:DNA-binding FadR family transcriptional regulator
MITLRSVARPHSLADEVAQALTAHILAGDWKPGDRLPTEMELGGKFEVSRAVVREAFSRLKSEGYVSTHQGKGAFVAEDPGLVAFRLDLDAGTGTAATEDLLELRTIVEQACAELAARRRTARDLAAMRRALEDMRSAYRDGGLGLEADIRFHESIATATHNSVLQRFMQCVGRHIREVIRVARLSVAKYEDKLSEIDGEHVAILKAIEKRDPKAARAAARLHIENGAKRLKLRARLSVRPSRGSPKSGARIGV